LVSFAQTKSTETNDETANNTNNQLYEVWGGMRGTTIITKHQYAIRLLLEYCLPAVDASRTRFS
jgi:hypothetical protein